MRRSSASSKLSGSSKKKASSRSAAAEVATSMSSRIIRGDERSSRLKISASPANDTLMPGGHPAHIEKQAFEQGYQEGERIGKQMGEKMVETIVRRYDKSIAEIAEAQKKLIEQM